MSLISASHFMVYFIKRIASISYYQPRLKLPDFKLVCPNLLTPFSQHPYAKLPLKVTSN
ncbi:hypothetical protein I79_002521 [Cricetulus griseus]|uniref:Uncharacterized protein n=1 Tax=Cricetulus griseus TaxID=10029 RepID=G3GXM9_CRIGR|nr:hypothetical protein I79_002521 [Cricetulus griseus]